MPAAAVRRLRQWHLHRCRRREWSDRKRHVQRPWGRSQSRSPGPLQLRPRRTPLADPRALDADPRRAGRTRATGTSSTGTNGGFFLGLLIRVIRCARKRTSRTTVAGRRASGSSFRMRPITFSPASLTRLPDLPKLDVRLAAGLCAFQSHIASRFSGTEGMPEFVILRGVFGGYTVRDPCASCGERLGSPLHDAGNAETCPRCQRASRCRPS